LPFVVLGVSFPLVTDPHPKRLVFLVFMLLVPAELVVAVVVGAAIFPSERILF
jgi:hypothetical protein